MKVVINRCYGGFRLSDEAEELLDEIAPGLAYKGYSWRASNALIAVVETLGLENSAGYCAKLDIIEVPDGIEFGIFDYDGMECVYEKGHVWPDLDS